MPPRRQGIYWLCTIPHPAFTPWLPPGVAYIRGQLELSNDTGYLHWQVLVVFEKKVSLPGFKAIFGDQAHGELSRSKHADEYVWKDDTRVEGTQFQLGTKPIRRNSKLDWERVWNYAKDGDIESIPENVRVQHYRTLRAIGSDYAKPIGMERSCDVFWGATGTGKSKRAWDEAGMDAYPKDPRTKWWDGYNGQRNVVIDEFRGAIDVSHVLRWLDRYPVLVEVKGSSRPLVAEKVWITSNLDPRNWYPEIDEDTKAALLRRLNITHFSSF